MAAKMALPGKCVFKGKCDLNYQVFVLNERDSLSSKSSCAACNHLCAFHEQNTETSGRLAAASSSTSNNRVKFHIIPEMTSHRLSVVKFKIKISSYFLNKALS